MNLFKLLVLLSAMLTILQGRAQVLLQNNCEKSRTLQWEFGGNLGYTQYYGDVSNKSYFKKFSGETKLGGGVFGRAIFNQLSGVGAHLSYFKLASEKDSLLKGTPLNNRYEGNVFQFGVHAYMNFSNLFWGIRPEERPVNLYGTVGLSYASWKGTLSNTITNAVIVDDGVNNSGVLYKNAGVILPLTLGLGIRLNDNLRMNVEGSLQTIMSDDADYYRDGFKNDILLYSSVGLSYIFTQQKTKKKPAPTDSDLSVIEFDYSQRRAQASPSRELPALNLISDQKISRDYEFRVQVIAMSRSRIDVAAFARKYNIETPVVENTFSGLYRYSTGRFNNFKDAEAYSKVIRSKGVFDAFVVAYRGNERILITAEMKQ